MVGIGLLLLAGAAGGVALLSLDPQVRAVLKARLAALKSLFSGK